MTAYKILYRYDGQGLSWDSNGTSAAATLARFKALASGTTAVSDTSTDGSVYFLVGRSQSDMPSLQFIGGLGATKTYTESGFVVTNASIDIGFAATVDASDLLVITGALDLNQETGSKFQLDGNGLIDAGGTMLDAAGGLPRGATFALNGTITVGPHGSNVLGLASVADLTGTGTIRQLGANDTTAIGAASAGIHVDVEAGELTVGSAAGHFDGTIGPVNGVGPSMGPLAELTFIPSGFAVQQVQSAAFDTSAGLLSLLGAAGQDLADFHFAGDASGLNVSFKSVPSAPVGTTSLEIAITDHPGSVSAIPISFS